jgi:hypothetical protein
VARKFTQFSKEDFRKHCFYSSRKSPHSRALEHSVSIYRTDTTAKEYDILKEKFDYVFQENKVIKLNA